MDWLEDVAVNVAETVAHRALVRFVEEGHVGPITVEWKVTDTDWWETDASFVD
jgi:hypothetical protein